MRSPCTKNVEVRGQDRNSHVQVWLKMESVRLWLFHPQTLALCYLLLSEMRNDHQVKSRAHEVLVRFIRWYVAVIRTRRTLKSLAILTRAFKSASMAQSTQRKTNKNALKMIARRDELTQRYSTALRHPPSPEHRLDEVVTKSAFVDRSQQIVRESSDEEEIHSPVVDKEAFETVIRLLHSHLNQLQWENATKSRRIDELEGLVARLSRENCELRSRQQEWIQPLDGTEPSNQTPT